MPSVITIQSARRPSAFLRRVCTAVCLSGIVSAAWTPSRCWPQTSSDAGRAEFTEIKNGLELQRPAIWRHPIGYLGGTPVIAGDKLLIGTDRDPHIDGKLGRDKGVLKCLDKVTGRLLWTAIHDKLPSRDNDLPGNGIQSRPAVDDDRIYYVSNRGEFMCLDLNGFHDAVNDGPFIDEPATGLGDADVVWRIDMVAQLGVYKRDAVDIMNPVSSPVVAGDLVYVITGHGSDHDHVANPDAPSFLAVKKDSGEIAWSSNLPGANIVYGQWASPVAVTRHNAVHVFFAGGDGWLYEFEGATGRLVWSRDCVEARRNEQRPGMRAHDFFVQPPVVSGDAVFFSLDQDLFATVQPRAVQALALDEKEPKGRQLWRFDDDGKFKGTLGTLLLHDGILYTVSTDGLLFALDAHTGGELWRADLEEPASPFGSPVVFQDKVLVASQSFVFVFAAQRTKELLTTYACDGGLHGTPMAAEKERLYLATWGDLFALPLAD